MSDDSAGFCRRVCRQRRSHSMPGAKIVQAQSAGISLSDRKCDNVSFFSAAGGDFLRQIVNVFQNITVALVDSAGQALVNVHVAGRTFLPGVGGLAAAASHTVIDPLKACGIG